LRIGLRFWECRWRDGNRTAFESGKGCRCATGPAKAEPEGLRGGATLCELGFAFGNVTGATAIELRSNPGRVVAARRAPLKRSRRDSNPRYGFIRFDSAPITTLFKKGPVFERCILKRLSEQAFSTPFVNTKAFGPIPKQTRRYLIRVTIRLYKSAAGVFHKGSCRMIQQVRRIRPAMMSPRSGSLSQRRARSWNRAHLPARHKGARLGCSRTFKTVWFNYAARRARPFGIRWYTRTLFLLSE